MGARKVNTKHVAKCSLVDKTKSLISTTHKRSRHISHCVVCGKHIILFFLPSNIVPKRVSGENTLIGHCSLVEQSRPCVLVVRINWI